MAAIKRSRESDAVRTTDELQLSNPEWKESPAPGLVAKHLDALYRIVADAKSRFSWLSLAKVKAVLPNISPEWAAAGTSLGSHAGQSHHPSRGAGAFRPFASQLDR